MFEPLTKEELLARVANAFDMGLLDRGRIALLDAWVDFVLRFEGGQMRYVADFLADEKARNHLSSPQNMAIGNLAGDMDGYALVRFAAILKHPCQKCAVDPNAWHTRSAFCNHRKPETTEDV